MAYLKKAWNVLGHSAVVDTHQYARQVQEKPGRNKYKCVHLDQETGLCEMNNIGCVGPSNSLCRDYCTNISRAKQPPCSELHNPLPIQPPSLQRNTVKRTTPVPSVNRPQQKSPSRPAFDIASLKAGTAVKHISAGKGKVIAITPASRTITVRFNGSDMDFSFPDTFEKGYLSVLPQEDPK